MLNFSKKKLLFFLFFAIYLNADVLIKNSQSKYCIGCHRSQVLEWLESMHSKSDKETNILYKSMIEFISQKEFKSVDNVTIKCAICHNPRLKIKQIEPSYSIAKAFGFENKEVKKVKDAINDMKAKEGINCVVCHQVSKIEDINGSYKNGYKQIVWGDSNLFFGPIDGNQSTHHKSQKREHFKEDVNKLCNVCHYTTNNFYSLNVCNTGLEVEFSGNNTKCVECHMSSKFEAKVGESLINQDINSTFIRKHTFSGVRNSNIVNKALEIDLKTDDKNIYFYIKNLTPHKIPTGFAGRELEIEVFIKDKNSKIIKSFLSRLKASYLDKDFKETIPYLGLHLKEDLRINPNEKREFIFPMEKEGSFVEIIIWYKLLNNELVNLLNIKDEVFIKKYLILKKELKL